MIEELKGLPQGVTGIRVSGKITGEQMREFKPTMQKLLDSDQIRFVEVIDPDYSGFGPGGLLQDIRQGFGAVFEHHKAFKRMAIVTDKEWIAHSLHALAWMVPGELELFTLDELDKATQWAAG